MPSTGSDWSSKVDTLIQTVTDFRSAMIDCCRRFIQIPSVNGIHDELDLANAVAEQASALGLHVQITGQNSRRPNVIVSTSADGETGLLLLAHLDTVPAGDEKTWTHPPFAGTVAGSRVYGRGAIDTKGGMTAALYALAAIARTADSLKAGRAQLICVPDEESGATGTLGIRYLRSIGQLKALGAIYAYSGNQIVLGHRGLIRYRLICEGEAVHTGAAEWQERRRGANAVTGMADLLLALERIDTTYSARAYFDRFKTVITPGTIIQGGSSINVVPGYCEALVDVRTTPEFDLDHMNDLLGDTLASVKHKRPLLRFRAEVLNFVPAAISDERAPLFAIVERAVEQVKFIRPERVVAGPANEGYLLIESGIPTVCGLGPTGDNAHAANEYVEIDGLVDAAAIFALTARRLSEYLV